MSNFLIIADDLTGANDTGVALARFNKKVNVVSDQDFIKYENSYVLYTESRAFSQEQAYETVCDKLSNIDFSKFTFVVKKIDSTLRGQIGSEIRAVDDTYKPDFIIFMPALPNLDRTTVGGIQKLKGIPISQTELSSDPKTPVLSDNIIDILQSQYKNEKVCHFDTEKIDNAKISLETGRLYTFDSITNEQMASVIKKVTEYQKQGKKVLWVGSGAIVDNIVQVIEPVSPAFGLVGSVSAITRAQLSYAKMRGIDIVTISPKDLVDGNYKPYIDSATAILQKGKDCILASAASVTRDTLEETFAIGERQGLDRLTVSDRVQDTLACVGYEIIKSTKISGLFLTGGDTGICLFNKFDIKSFEIVSEVLVGIPLMRLEQLNNMKVITKAGAFGGDDAIAFAMRKLRG